LHVVLRLAVPLQSPRFKSNNKPLRKAFGVGGNVVDQFNLTKPAGWTPDAAAAQVRPRLFLCVRVIVP
jgi:hypothetical protein